MGDWSVFLCWVLGNSPSSTMASQDATFIKGLTAYSLCCPCGLCTGIYGYVSNKDSPNEEIKQWAQYSGGAGVANCGLSCLFQHLRAGAAVAAVNTYPHAAALMATSLAAHVPHTVAATASMGVVGGAAAVAGVCIAGVRLAGH